MNRGMVVSSGALGVGSCLAHPSKTGTWSPVFLEPLVVSGMSFKNHKQVSGSPVKHLELRGNSSLFAMIPAPGDFNLLGNLGPVFPPRKSSVKHPRQLWPSLTSVGLQQAHSHH